VRLAREVGEQLGSIAYVLTSDSPRAVETAVAMGLAVDDTVAMPSGYVSGEAEFHQQLTWPQPWSRYAELIARGEGLARVTEAQQAIWIGALQQVEDGAAALIVGHGGGLEPALVACFPDAEYRRWGSLFGHCDGARLGFADGRFVDLRIRRAPTASADSTSAS
jgi:broad specificity phosphatase PhoE